MALYKVIATATTSTSTSTKSGRCTAVDIKAVLQKLFIRFPDMTTANTLNITVALSDEEDLT